MQCLSCAGQKDYIGTVISKDRFINASYVRGSEVVDCVRLRIAAIVSPILEILFASCLPLVFLPCSEHNRRRSER